jgi:hypothetical protein
MVLITPRLVRALEPDEVPPLPTLPRRFLPAPGIEKGAPGNPEKTDKSGVGASDGPQSTVLDPAAVRNEKNDGKSAGRRPGSED